MFFVIEGIDGSGKTTQIELLHSYMLSKKIKAVTTREPTSGFVGRLTKRIMQGREDVDTLTLQMLFIADRADHLNKFIRPNISQGNIVISDRYFYSTIAFGSASGLEENWLIDVFKGFMKPDAVFFIDVDPKTAMQRIESRGEQKRLAKKADKRERYEKLETLEKTRKIYLDLKKHYKNYYIIDGNRSIKEVSEDIIQIADKMLKAPVV